MRGGLYTLMALGLTLVFGVMNIPQFAHGEFYMVGAYVAYFSFQTLGLDPLSTIFSAAVAGFIVGAATERLLLRTLHQRSRSEWILNSFLLTVGISFAMQNAAQALFGANFRGITRYWTGSLRLATSMEIAMDRVVGFAIALLAIASFWVFLKRTQTGRAIRAVAQDETGAMLIGINLDRIRLLSFALSTMLAAVAGASLLSMNPAHPTMGVEPLYKSWYVVILAGLGNMAAAVPAGFLVGILETFNYYFFGAAWQNVVSLSLLIVVLLFRPSGIFGAPVRGVWER